MADTAPAAKAAPKPEAKAEQPAKAEAKSKAEPKPEAKPAPKKPAPAAKAPARPAPNVAVAGAARVRGRHWRIITSFLCFVILPAALVVYYLYGRAADQYASSVGFAVRTAEVSTPLPSLLSGIGGLGIGGSSSKDTDILYEFIQSQALVVSVDKTLDLHKIYSKPEGDPYFAFDPDGTVEDLTEYWRNMVKIFYDAGSGLIELRVHAFTAQDAQDIATAVVEESTRMINKLSAVAQKDATSYAREDLTNALEQLKGARQALSEFRSRNQIVDPSADIAGQVGLVTGLQQRLADALIERRELLETSSRKDDPRRTQIERTIRVIEEQIEEERRKFGLGAAGGDGESFTTILGEFERLQVDREYAEQTYLAAQATFAKAQAEAQRQSRYLAAYIQPTLPEKALYPQRALLSSLVFGFLTLTWMLGVLLFYSIKDRR